MAHLELAKIVTLIRVRIVIYVDFAAPHKVLIIIDQKGKIMILMRKK